MLQFLRTCRDFLDFFTSNTRQYFIDFTSIGIVLYLCGISDFIECKRGELSVILWHYTMANIYICMDNNNKEIIIFYDRFILLKMIHKIKI